MQGYSTAEASSKFGSGMDGVRLIASTYGVSSLDVLLSMTLGAWAFVCYVVAFAMFAVKRRSVCRTYRAISAAGVPTARKMSRLTFVSFVVAFLAMVAASSLFSAGMGVAYELFSSERGGDGLSARDWAFVVCFGVGNFLYITNPMFQSIVQLVWDMVLALTEAFQKWTASTKKLKEPTASHLSQGRRLCALVEQVEGTLSPFLLFGYTYFLVAGVMYTFGGCDVLYVSRGRLSAAFLAVGFFLYASACCFALWIVSDVGNGLKRAKVNGLPGVGKPIIRP